MTVHVVVGRVSDHSSRACCMRAWAVSARAALLDAVDLTIKYSLDTNLPGDYPPTKRLAADPWRFY